MACEGNESEIDNLPDKELHSGLIDPNLGENHTYLRKLAITDKEQLRFKAECPQCDAYWDYPAETTQQKHWYSNELEWHVYKLLAIHLIHSHFRNFTDEIAVCWCGHSFGPLPYINPNTDYDPHDMDRNQYASNLYERVINHCCAMNSSVNGHFKAHIAHQAITKTLGN